MKKVAFLFIFFAFVCSIAFAQSRICINEFLTISPGAGFRIENVKIDNAFDNLPNQPDPLITYIFSN